MANLVSQNLRNGASVSENAAVAPLCPVSSSWATRTRAPTAALGSGSGGGEAAAWRTTRRERARDSTGRRADADARVERLSERRDLFARRLSHFRCALGTWTPASRSSTASRCRTLTRWLLWLEPAAFWRGKQLSRKVSCWSASYLLTGCKVE